VQASKKTSVALKQIKAESVDKRCESENSNNLVQPNGSLSKELIF
jgi:hypothetical protein